MPSNTFRKNFEKTAVIGAALKAVGKGVMRLGGGPLNTVMTGMQAVGDFNQNKAKMIQAGMR